MENQTSTPSWTRKRDEKKRSLNSMAHLAEHAIIKKENIVEALQYLLQPGDKVVLEGDNQKQASFLAEALLQVDTAKVNKLHMIMSSISLPEHLDIFERGIAENLIFRSPARRACELRKCLKMEHSRWAKYILILNYTAGYL
jgi:malonate decarboxylase alpha subunit